MRRIAAGIAFAACLMSACSVGSSTLELTSTSVDQSYQCPVGANNSPYDVHTTVAAHNGTSKSVTISSVTGDLTLEAVNGPWLEKVGDKFQADKITVAPSSVAPGATSSLKVTIPSACTNGKATGGASYGDYRVTLHFATSAGNFSISSKALHRLVAA
jgi:hypothetical protein